jgi:hypothetical protein
MEGAKDGMERDLAVMLDKQARARIVSTMLEDHSADVRIEPVAGQPKDLNTSVLGGDPCHPCLWIHLKDSLTIANC